MLSYLTFLVFIASVSSSSILTVYNQTFQYGDFKLVSIDGCTNLPKKWQNSVSALDLHDSCFIFYTNTGCHGKRVTLQPYHKKYSDNLHSIGFNDVIASVSECGFKIRHGPHIIRSVMDGSVVSLVPMKHEVFASTMMRPWVKSQNQVWFVGRYGPRIGINYGLKPLTYQHYNPVSYQTFEPRPDGGPYMPERYYDIKPLPGSKFAIKLLHSDKCLVNRGMGKPIGKTGCRAWKANQQFNFIPVQVNNTGPRLDVRPIHPIPIL